MDHPTKVAPEYKNDIEDKVQKALYLIDSGHESEQAWNFIRHINNCFMAKPKLCPKEQRILDSIQPIIEKYGQHDSRGVALDSDRKAEIKGKHTPTNYPSKGLNKNG